MRKRTLIALFLILLVADAAFAQKVIHLNGSATPASETTKRKEYFSKAWQTDVVTNVTDPTLTAYLPAAEPAARTAIVICPGGGFHALAIEKEGIDVAKWLNARGVAAFVLEYHLVPTGEDGAAEFNDKYQRNRQKLDRDIASDMPLAAADARSAIAYVRAHASEFRVSPTRIGLMGFSAGGTLTAAVAYDHTAESRPDFIAPIYGYLGPMKDAAVPKDAAPMFVAAASDDFFGLAPDSVNIYSKWLAAGKSAELHIYSKGGHGFGIVKHNLPVDTWIDRFGDWLQLQGLLKPAAQT